jgi:hypothetical protein
MDLHASFHQDGKPLLLHLIMRPIYEPHIALPYHSCFGNASLTLLIKVCEVGIYDFELILTLQLFLTILLLHSDTYNVTLPNRHGMLGNYY